MTDASRLILSLITHIFQRRIPRRFFRKHVAPLILRVSGVAFDPHPVQLMRLDRGVEAFP